MMALPHCRKARRIDPHGDGNIPSIQPGPAVPRPNGSRRPTLRLWSRRAQAFAAKASTQLWSPRESSRSQSMPAGVLSRQSFGLGVSKSLTHFEEPLTTSKWICYSAGSLSIDSLPNHWVKWNESEDTRTSFSGFMSSFVPFVQPSSSRRTGRSGCGDKRKGSRWDFHSRRPRDVRPYECGRTQKRY